MKKDKAIEQALKNQVETLPAGFEAMVMEKVFIEAKRKERRSYVLNLLLISIISLGMLTGIFFLLKEVYSFNVFEHIAFNFFSLKNKDFFLFYFYIAFLILGLLGVDHFLRQWVKKTKGSC